jgi:hypothetical protein
MIIASFGGEFVNAVLADSAVKWSVASSRASGQRGFQPSVYFGRPVLCHDGGVACLLSDGTVTKISEDGRVIWSRKIPGKVVLMRDAVTVADDSVVVATATEDVTNGTWLYRFSADGHKMWRAPGGPDVRLAVSRSGRVVYACGVGTPASRAIAAIEMDRWEVAEGQ